jgi:hypothetical protein
MNTHSTVLDNTSAEATTSDRILQTALAALRQEYAVPAEDLVEKLTGQKPMQMLDYIVKNKALFVAQQEKHQTNPNVGVAT